MSFNTLESLLAQRAIVDIRIRAQRVFTIRQMTVLVGKPPKKLANLLEEMERRLSMVNYNHSEFDDLLDQIEESF